MFEPGDLETETFTNSQGWTMVRVTHVPSGVVAERERNPALVSPVQAHDECIAEIKSTLGSPPASTTPASSSVVSRADFEALVARVEALERRSR